MKRIKLKYLNYLTINQDNTGISNENHNFQYFKINFSIGFYFVYLIPTYN